MKEALIMISTRAEPYEFTFDPAKTALVMIDFQRDFVYPGGFGESLGNDTSYLLKALPPAERVLKACRAAGIFVVHTREGHRADLSDLPVTKYERGQPSLHIGDPGPMGRLLVRGEYGHDIVEEVYPIDGEPVVDKPGKGAFYATDMDAILKTREIRYLIVCGVTTEVCVQTSVREANDRGYDALVLADCTGSYFPEFQRVALEMNKAQGGIFGWVGESTDFLEALGQGSPDAVTAAAGSA
jgi:biuret amidohydrolase